MADEAWFPSVCLFVGYVAVAQGLGNLYPFSRFEMYAHVDAHTASRVLVIDRDEEARELVDFTALRCPPVDLPSACGDGEYYRIGYVDREAALALAARSTAPMVGLAHTVHLVRRIWRFRGPGAPSVEDCAIATCEASGP